MKKLIVALALIFALAPVVNAATYYKSIEIPLNAFTLTYQQVTTNKRQSRPYWDMTNTSPAIVWTDRNLIANSARASGNGWEWCQISPVVVRFQVPPNYNKNGEWRAVLTRDDNTAVTDKTVAVDYSYFVNREGTLWDESTDATDPVYLSLTAEAYPDVVTLSGPTAMQAEDWVTFKMWRYPGGSDKVNLRLLNVMFYYYPKY